MAKKNFPKKYEPSAFQDHVKKAKKAFDSEDYVEAFVFLYTVLEAYLLTVWAEFTFLFSSKKILNIYDVHDWKYFECVELLYEVNMITSDQKSIFINFKKGRDNVVHNLTHPMKVGKLKVKTLDAQFKLGLKSFDIVYKLTIDLTQVKIGQKNLENILKTP